MASENSVMGVIRAARPSFQNRHDKAAFAVHAAFVAAGYVLHATGPSAMDDGALSSCSTTDEVGMDNWNKVNEKYAFVYSHSEKGSKKVLVKCLTMNDKLIVDVLKEGDSEHLNLKINVADYVADDGGTNYGSQFKNMGKLVANVNKDIVGRLDGSSTASSSSYTISCNSPAMATTSNPADPLSFFKIIVEPEDNIKIQLLREFIARWGDRVPCRITLKLANGSPYEMELIPSDWDTCIHKGLVPGENMVEESDRTDTNFVRDGIMDHVDDENSSLLVTQVGQEEIILGENIVEESHRMDTNLQQNDPTDHVDDENLPLPVTEAQRNFSENLGIENVQAECSVQVLDSESSNLISENQEETRVLVVESVNDQENLSIPDVEIDNTESPSRVIFARIMEDSLVISKCIERLKQITNNISSTLKPGEVGPADGGLDNSENYFSTWGTCLEKSVLENDLKDDKEPFLDSSNMVCDDNEKEDHSTISGEGTEINVEAVTIRSQFKTEYPVLSDKVEDTKEDELNDSREGNLLSCDTRHEDHSKYTTFEATNELSTLIANDELAPVIETVKGTSLALEGTKSSMETSSAAIHDESIKESNEKMEHIPASVLIVQDDVVKAANNSKIEKPGVFSINLGVKSISKDEGSFMLDISRDSSKGSQSSSSIQACELSMTVKGSPSTPVRSQTVPKAEHKTRRASTNSGKESARKRNQVKETPPPLSQLVAGQLVATVESATKSKIESATKSKGAVVSVPTSSLPDLNTSAVLFQQPFTDLQQVQLRAQIFVCESLIRGAAPDEACMVSAFGMSGSSDGGRRTWRPCWRCFVDRLRGKKSLINNDETPTQSRSGATTNISALQTEQPHPSSSASRASNKTLPYSSMIPSSSLLSTMSTPSSNQTPPGYSRGPLFDQTPPRHNLVENSTASLSAQSPFPIPWLTTSQSSPFNNTITEPVKLSHVKETKLLSPIPGIHSPGSRTIFPGSSPSQVADLKKGTSTSPEEEYGGLKVLAFEREATIASLEEELQNVHIEKEEITTKYESLVSSFQESSDELDTTRSELSTLKKSDKVEASGRSKRSGRKERRKRVLWTKEEENMLVEGVLKFTSTGKTNIPWREILEFGRPVFQASRTPADLKAKWQYEKSAWHLLYSI